ncbi:MULTISPECIES: DUF992 domain-containing protein [Rhodoplanes]|uniref:DUF992 domain-containing protein n=1 Tax=Rhodoplanes serenus TaxID=200615 RepID=A0A327JPJ7_9BRAD|nr:DUF992 domain-containing protein [Rhodoplanes serenus]MBI5113038.1 DUF992 domain-containing protein [Rhodovulum sp.]RAI27283.1 hypothetical protein CH340_24565 [Rhodoplanes serenus]VCU10813.1 hypothetical protein RHODGE_RHODGE_04378 [Rhodoplanes serenus]
MSRLKVALLLAGSAVFASVPAAAQPLVNVGTLACQVSPTIGMVVGSTQQAHCVFKPNRGRKQTAYVGAVSRVGLDVGVSQGGPIVWSVWAPTPRLPRRALAGSYTGASSSLAVGIGLGSNVLVGGPYRSITLQPAMLQNYVGVNVALGVSGLTLR